MLYETGRFAHVSQKDVSRVKSREDLADVLVRLRVDLLDTGEREWENGTLDRYLSALETVLLDHQFSAQPAWTQVARLLVTATGYE